MASRACDDRREEQMRSLTSIKDVVVGLDGVGEEGSSATLMRVLTVHRQLLVQGNLAWWFCLGRSIK